MDFFNNLANSDYADLIVENANLNLFPELTQLTELNYKYSVVNIPASLLSKCSLGRLKYSLFPKCFTLQSTTAIENTGVNIIQSNPSFQLKGNGTIIGIIDTGIDYLNNSFRYANGDTRIVSIWDQTINEGNFKSPIGLFYGAEFTRDMINKALESDNPLDIVPSIDTNGHGTAIAGIAGGSENIENNFRGVVPQCEFIIVKLKKAKEITMSMFNINNDVECYQETDILFAIKYIIEYATVLKRPVSICISIGTNQGSHTGLEILSSYISQLSRIVGIGVSVAAGNEGNTRRHYNGVCYANIPYKEFNIVIDPKDKMFFIEIWQVTPQRLSIEVISPTGENTQRINPTIDNCYKHSFLFENSTIWINNMLIENTTGAQLIIIRFDNVMDGIWSFRLYNIDNIDTPFNAWLPSGSIISDDTYFLNSSPDTTITPPGDAHYAMTFGAYDSDNNSIYISSGRGYTTSGIVKPDMASPGVNMIAPTLDNKFELITGTGAASAFASGIVSMILEWAISDNNWISMNGIEMKELLIRGATRDQGTIYPNSTWGYGKINIYGFFDKLRI